jgi:hypothetical protein
MPAGCHKDPQRRCTKPFWSRTRGRRGRRIVVAVAIAAALGIGSMSGPAAADVPYTAPSTVCGSTANTGALYVCKAWWITTSALATPLQRPKHIVITPAHWYRGRVYCLNYASDHYNYGSNRASGTVNGLRLSSRGYETFDVIQWADSCRYGTSILTSASASHGSSYVSSSLTRTGAGRDPVTDARRATGCSQDAEGVCRSGYYYRVRATSLRSNYKARVVTIRARLRAVRIPATHGYSGRPDKTATGWWTVRVDFRRPRIRWSESWRAGAFGSGKAHGTAGTVLAGGSYRIRQS